MSSKNQERILSLATNLVVSSLMGTLLFRALKLDIGPLISLICLAALILYLTFCTGVELENVSNTGFSIPAWLFSFNFFKYLTMYEATAITIVIGCLGWLPIASFLPASWKFIMIGMGIIQLLVGWIGTFIVISGE